ncbi:MAG: YiiX/YebB-like N1pC/P60 family cysteine hydrolase [Thermodesulfobacteriota bacterium]|nr:YiiX/YebB-like N1pC/P60 family cysteine hydrolase [Thermodesulfobacteriota bacterium]
MNSVRGFLRNIGHHLAKYLSQPRPGTVQIATSSPGQLAATLQPGDVLLVDGSSRVSGVIKYLTQSSWSHAALYVGPGYAEGKDDQEKKVLLEADILEGIRLIPLSEYSSSHTRICRPVGLATETIEQLIAYGVERLGHQYDLKNVFDLVRFLVLPTPIPTRWRRKLLTLGSGDPTRAICSSLIAQAFQSIRYPILPEIDYQQSTDSNGQIYCQETLTIRHHSLFVPRDFDVSPYFEIIKPVIMQNFDSEKLVWELHPVVEDQQKS